MPIHSSFLPNPWQPLVFLVSIVLPFPEYHSVGIVYSMQAFAHWFLLLSNILFKFPPCLFMA